MVANQAHLAHDLAENLANSCGPNRFGVALVDNAPFHDKSDVLHGRNILQGILIQGDDGSRL